MDFPRHCWLWETPIRSGHRTDRFDAHKNGYLLDWRDDEHLQAQWRNLSISGQMLWGVRRARRQHNEGWVADPLCAKELGSLPNGLIHDVKHDESGRSEDD